MSSLSGIINVARSSITANQTAIRIASQNITNADTDGYSRQRVTMVDSRPDVTLYGRLGTGVRVIDIDRVRDTLLDTSYRKEAGRAASFEQRNALLGRVQEILGEPSETGLASSLDEFYASWADLSNQPTSETAKRVVLQRSGNLASTLNGFSSRLDELAQTTRGQLNTTVQEINRITSEIAKLNELVVREESTGLNAPDLRDQRDRMIDQLSKFSSVRTTNRSNGTVAVFVENSLLVDGVVAKPLFAAGEPPVVTAAGSTLNLSAEGSVIGELVTALTTRIPGVQARLDEMAGALVEQTNALHRAGFLADGTPGTNFFDPAATTARDINVVATTATLVTSDAPLQPNNNRIALAMSNMRTKADQNDIAMGVWTPAQAALMGGVSAGEHYRTTVADLAVETRLAEDSHTVFSTLEEQLSLRRKSVSGVSTDEEMIRVMQHQQAYAAAARLVNVVDEMFQTVLDLKR